MKFLLPIHVISIALASQLYFSCGKQKNAAENEEPEEHSSSGENTNNNEAVGSQSAPESQAKTQKPEKSPEELLKEECNESHTKWINLAEEIKSKRECVAKDDCTKFPYGDLNLDQCYQFDVVSKDGLENGKLIMAKSLYEDVLNKCVKTEIIKNEGGVCLLDIMPIADIDCVENECKPIYMEFD